MKFCKHIFLLFSILFVHNIVSAHYSSGTVTGVGCNLGNKVYTQKIGTSNFWGTQYDVYNANGANYAIDWNNSSQCNYINSNNIVDQGKACWVSSYVNPTNNNSGVSYGSLVYYSVQTCSVNPPVGLPLDDYIWVLLAISAGFGAYMITKRQLHSSF